LSVLLPSIFGLVVIVAVTRLIDRSFVNDYFVASAFVSAFVVLSDMGISTAFIRDVAKDNSIMDKYFTNYYLLHLIAASSMKLRYSSRVLLSSYSW
jgi:O-antigen/teichoic acid export membrane protein